MRWFWHYAHFVVAMQLVVLLAHGFLDNFRLSNAKA